ncbi:MAG: hypothetical protein Q9226_008081 [Calogaya cf. arnoldii]
MTFSLPPLSYYADVDMSSMGYSISPIPFFPSQTGETRPTAPTRKTTSIKTLPSTGALPSGIKEYVNATSGNMITMLMISSFYDLGKLTDLTIKCGSEEFRCHKIVVCSQSKFFEAACTSGFSETATSTVNLEENPSLIRIMLDFLYTQTYDLPTTSLTEEMDEDGDDESLNNLIALYALGDKYAISSLCQHAALDFEEIVHDPEQTLLSSIPQLYSSIPENDRMLRDLFLKEIIFRHRFNSTAKMDADVETLLEAMEENVEFRKDMTLCLLKKVRESAMPKKEMSYGGSLFGNRGPYPDSTEIFRNIPISQTVTHEPAVAVDNKPSAEWALLKGIKEFYDDGQYTDLTITCGKEEFKCHKIVLCAQSEFFKTMCSNPNTSTLDLSEGKVEQVKLMLEFLYTGTYDILTHPYCNHSEPVRCANIILLYAMAQRFKIPALRKHAHDDLKSIVNESRNTDFLLGRIPTVYEFTTETDRSLRDILVESIIKHCRSKEEDLLKAASEREDFRKDLILGLLRNGKEDGKSAKKPDHGLAYVHRHNFGASTDRKLVCG